VFFKALAEELTSEFSTEKVNPTCSKKERKYEKK